MPKQFITHQAHRKIIDSVVDGFTGRSDEEAKRALAGEVVDLREAVKKLEAENEVLKGMVAHGSKLDLAELDKRFMALMESISDEEINKFFDQ